MTTYPDGLPNRRHLPHLILCAALLMTPSATAAATDAHPTSAARQAPASLAGTAEPATPAQAPPPRLPARPVPSRNVTLEVTVAPFANDVPGARRVLTVTMAEGRDVQVRRQPGTNYFSLDATCHILNQDKVLLDLKLNVNSSADPAPDAQVSIVQEGSILLVPGASQQLTRLNDSGGRPGLLVSVKVTIVP
jgi:hypothetical protein